MNLQSDATYSINGNGRLFNDFPTDFRVPQFFPYSKTDSRCPRVIHASRQTFNAPGRSVFQGILSISRVIRITKPTFKTPHVRCVSKQTFETPHVRCVSRYTFKTPHVRCVSKQTFETPGPLRFQLGTTLPFRTETPHPSHCRTSFRTAPAPPQQRSRRKAAD